MIKKHIAVIGAIHSIFFLLFIPFFSFPVAEALTGVLGGALSIAYVEYHIMKG